MKKLILSLMILTGLILASSPVLAFTLPTGEAVTLAEVEAIIILIARFLVIIGTVLLVIFIVISGIMYITARGDATRLKNAKTTFKNAIVAGLIIIGVGVIINTITAVITRRFFLSF